MYVLQLWILRCLYVLNCIIYRWAQQKWSVFLEEDHKLFTSQTVLWMKEMKSSVKSTGNEDLIICNNIPVRSINVTGFRHSFENSYTLSLSLMQTHKLPSTSNKFKSCQSLENYSEPVKYIVSFCVVAQHLLSSVLETRYGFATTSWYVYVYEKSATSLC